MCKVLSESYDKSYFHGILLRWLKYYSFLKKKIKILKYVKLKPQDVSSSVLVTAIDVKCNFTKEINANQGKMVSIVTELLEGGMETRHFKGLFLKT